MGDVSSGVVVGDEDYVEVGKVVELGLWSLAAAVRSHPLNSVPRVVVGNRDTVLQAPPIVDRDDDGVGRRGERIGLRVVDLGVGGLDDETAAVDVDEEQELPTEGGGRREEETGGNVCFRRNGDVVLRDIESRHYFRTMESLHNTTFKNSEIG